MGRWALGSLGLWVVGPLGHWALGPLGHWALGRLGLWALGPLGHWALGSLGAALTTRIPDGEIGRWKSTGEPLAGRGASEQVLIIYFYIYKSKKTIIHSSFY